MGGSLSKSAEEDECGFCVYMKEGGCKEAYMAWDMCTKQAEKKKEKDIATKCYRETFNLIKCMQAHQDYYAPLLPGMKADKTKQ